MLVTVSLSDSIGNAAKISGAGRALLLINTQMGSSERLFTHGSLLTTESDLLLTLSFLSTQCMECFLAYIDSFVTVRILLSDYHCYMGCETHTPACIRCTQVLLLALSNHHCALATLSSCSATLTDKIPKSRVTSSIPSSPTSSIHTTILFTTCFTPFINQQAVSAQRQVCHMVLPLARLHLYL